jgi:four helix bundle protein
MALVKSHFDLDVYKNAFEAATTIFGLSRGFPKEETYSLTDQLRHSSRSVCGNIAEAWRKRIYEAAFISKVNDAEAEAAESQSWIQFAVKCEYISAESGREVFHRLEEVIRMLVVMRCNPEKWCIQPDKKNEERGGNERGA